MAIGVLVGTRPEIIKMSPVIRELLYRKEEFVLLHTGQHYSYGMDKVFFQDLGLPEPDYHFDANRADYYAQMSKIISGTEKCIKEEKISMLLVQGDTNSVLAGAIAAGNAKALLGHVESGLRSRDLRMQEEYNRFLVDHMSDALFAPTEEAAENLFAEGIPGEKVTVTGNTIVDAVQQNMRLAKKPKDGKKYMVLTLHRAENVDDKTTLSSILEGIGRVAESDDSPIIFPMHPRTKSRMLEFGLKLPRKVVEREPMGYLEFLGLLSEAKLALTDSGGIQEEACTLGIPCVTLRLSTERPETVEAGANEVSGTDSGRIAAAAKKMLASKGKWKNPFGDGKAAGRIVETAVRISR